MTKIKYDTNNTSIFLIFFFLPQHMNLSAGYPGGVPTSLHMNADEQWDFPNSWPPLVHMLIEGLAGTKNESARDLAFDLAQTWIISNFEGWKKHSAMFEKVGAVAS